MDPHPKTLNQTTSSNSRNSTKGYQNTNSNQNQNDQAFTKKFSSLSTNFHIDMSRNEIQIDEYGQNFGFQKEISGAQKDLFQPSNYAQNNKDNVPNYNPKKNEQVWNNRERKDERNRDDRKNRGDDQRRNRDQKNRYEKSSYSSRSDTYIGSTDTYRPKNNSSFSSRDTYIRSDSLLNYYDRSSDTYYNNNNNDKNLNQNPFSNPNNLSNPNNFNNPNLNNFNNPNLNNFNNPNLNNFNNPNLNNPNPNNFNNPNLNNFNNPNTFNPRISHSNFNQGSYWDSKEDLSLNNFSNQNNFNPPFSEDNYRLNYKKEQKVSNIRDERKRRIRKYANFQQISIPELQPPKLIQLEKSVGISHPARIGAQSWRIEKTKIRDPLTVDGFKVENGIIGGKETPIDPRIQNRILPLTFQFVSPKWQKDENSVKESIPKVAIISFSSEPQNLQESSLRQKFKTFGNIEKITIQTSPEIIAIIVFSKGFEARLAMQTLNGTKLFGATVNISLQEEIDRFPAQKYYGNEYSEDSRSYKDPQFFQDPSSYYQDPYNQNQNVPYQNPPYNQNILFNTQNLPYNQTIPYNQNIPYQNPSYNQYPPHSEGIYQIPPEQTDSRFSQNQLNIIHNNQNNNNRSKKQDTYSSQNDTRKNLLTQDSKFPQNQLNIKNNQNDENNNNNQKIKSSPNLEIIKTDNTPKKENIPKKKPIAISRLFKESENLILKKLKSELTQWIDTRILESKIIEITSNLKPKTVTVKEHEPVEQLSINNDFLSELGSFKKKDFISSVNLKQKKKTTIKPYKIKSSQVGGKKESRVTDDDDDDDDELDSSSYLEDFSDEEFDTLPPKKETLNQKTQKVQKPKIEKPKYIPEEIEEGESEEENEKESDSEEMSSENENQEFILDVDQQKKVQISSTAQIIKKKMAQAIKNFTIPLGVCEDEYLYDIVEKEEKKKELELTRLVQMSSNNESIQKGAKKVPKWFLEQQKTIKNKRGESSNSIFPRVNPTGCARMEPFRKISHEEKIHYLEFDLPEDLETFELRETNSLSSDRSKRAQLRRKSQFEVRDDMFKNRKKKLKFAKSPIHDWGLFALEYIGKDEFVIEYVGEVIRSVIADLREQRYEKVGIGSSYLFRIDSEFVVDATTKGSIARFINHSCEPNCYAKIITSEGQKHIVIYSKRPIEIGEEITYDYKFPLEDDKIPCYCGAEKCRGFLN